MGEISLGSGDFERLLGDTRRALGALRSGNGDASRTADSGAEPVTGNGSAADGKITAKVVAGGRLEELTVDPRLMRQGSEEMCAQIMVAVNAALDELRANTAQAAPAAMDPAALADMMADLQTESVQQMNRFTQGIAETVAKISQASGGSGRAG